MLVKTGEHLIRKGKLYEVIIADDNIFVICPIKYSEEEESYLTYYEKCEVYSNLESINTLKNLHFGKTELDNWRKLCK